jgi:Domain of unknown function (DUF4252)
MPHRLCLAALACFVLAARADAQSPSPELRLPAFDHLRSQATEAVDLTLGPLPFSLVGSLIDDRDADSAETRALFRGLHRLAVRHYEFASDFVYAKADLDAVRAQLAQPGWSRIAHVRDQKKQEDIDIYLAVDKDRIMGLAIVASEPREFTIVNASGSLSMDTVNALRGRFVRDPNTTAAVHGPALPF